MKNRSLRRTAVQCVIWLWLAAGVRFQSANATALLVYNNNDNGAGSLRQALADNQALGGGSTITFSNTVTGNITLAGAQQLVISTNVTILGPGAGILTLNGNHASRILLINSGAVNLSGLTFANGDSDLADSPRGGAAIQNHGTCAINNVVFLNNTNFNFGGAIYNLGTLTCTNCTFANGAASQGGALHNPGTATLKNCTLSGNDTYRGGTGGGGGGIFSLGTLVLCSATPGTPGEVPLLFPAVPPSPVAPLSATAQILKAVVVCMWSEERLPFAIRLSPATRALSGPIAPGSLPRLDIT